MRRMVMVVLLLALAGCDRGTEPTAPMVGPTGHVLSLASMSTSQDPTPDQLAVAAAVPGFGGYFIDETGAPTVYLTDPDQRPAAEVALAGFLESFGWTGADLVVRQAEYDYLELHDWHTSVWPQALSVSGSVFSHIDESANRLRFGGLDVGVVSQITTTLTQSGVPTDAFVVEVTGPVTQLASLRDKTRPPVGGLQIQFFATPASPLVFLCTLGFNAVIGGVNSFITNSHCTNVQGSTDLRTDYYQATRGGIIPDPDNFIGFEVDDPEYFMGGECPIGRRCRYSDAARARYGAGQTFTLGHIARTAILNDDNLNGDSDDSILQIDALDPSYRIAAEQARPIMGQVLNKVGRTTGWTSGEVTATCVNINISASEITQLCESLVAAFVGGGDSGSPVFGEHTDGTAFLAGILWGSRSDIVTGEVLEFIFSPLADVESELGELDVVDPDLDDGKGGGKKKGHAQAPGRQKKVN